MQVQLNSNYILFKCKHTLLIIYFWKSYLMYSNQYESLTTTLANAAPALFYQQKHTLEHFIGIPIPLLLRIN